MFKYSKCLSIFIKKHLANGFGQGSCAESIHLKISNQAKFMKMVSGRDLNLDCCGKLTYFIDQRYASPNLDHFRNQLGTVSAFVMISVPWSDQRAQQDISKKLLSKNFTVGLRITSKY